MWNRKLIPLWMILGLVACNSLGGGEVYTTWRIGVDEVKVFGGFEAPDRQFLVSFIEKNASSLGKVREIRKLERGRIRVFIEKPAGRGNGRSGYEYILKQQKTGWSVVSLNYWMS
jgi:hypothetical protein